jgi:hypothetical protein
MMKMFHDIEAKDGSNRVDICEQETCDYASY